MNVSAGAAAFLMVWTYMLGADGKPIGGDLTIQPMPSLAQCEVVGQAASVWLRGHYSDGADWKCVEAPPPDASLEIE